MKATCFFICVGLFSFPSRPRYIERRRRKYQEYNQEEISLGPPSPPLQRLLLLCHLCRRFSTNGPYSCGHGGRNRVGFFWRISLCRRRRRRPREAVDGELEGGRGVKARNCNLAENTTGRHKRKGPLHLPGQPDLASGNNCTFGTRRTASLSNISTDNLT